MKIVFILFAILFLFILCDTENNLCNDINCGDNFHCSDGKIVFVMRGIIKMGKFVF